MNWETHKQACAEFDQMLNQADDAVRKFGPRMVGRLDRLDAETLSKLKRELRRWDITRSRWTDR